MSLITQASIKQEANSFIILFFLLLLQMIGTLLKLVQAKQNEKFYKTLYYLYKPLPIHCGLFHNLNYIF